MIDERTHRMLMRTAGTLLVCAILLFAGVCIRACQMGVFKHPAASAPAKAGN